MADKRKKGYWTISKVVKVTYTRREDWENEEEPANFKDTVMDAESHIDDGFSDFGETGMNIESIDGENWQIEDFEEPEEDE